MALNGRFLIIATAGPDPLLTFGSILTERWVTDYSSRRRQLGAGKSLATAAWRRALKVRDESVSRPGRKAIGKLRIAVALISGNVGPTTTALAPSRPEPVISARGAVQPQTMMESPK